MSNLSVRSTVIGIALGTTCCSVGYWRNGHVEIIENELGHRTTPAYVSFSDRGRTLGEAAKVQAALNPKNTIYNAKRLIGRRFDDQEIQADLKRFPFKTSNNGGRIMIHVDYLGEERLFSPEEILAMLLVHMKEIAQAHLGAPVKDAVVTVPACFNYLQRQGILDAGLISGLHIVRLIDEPNAAVTSYCLNNIIQHVVSNQTILVFNLGGGTFDVSLMQIEDGVCDVKASAGDPHLGGEDLDSRLMNHFAVEFRWRYGKDLFSDPRALQRLRSACQRAKHDLSVASMANIDIESLCDGIDFSATLSRARLEELYQDAFLKIFDLVETVLTDSKTKKEDVYDFVLAGGSTRIPRIAELLAVFFNGKKAQRRINPDEAGVYGASIHAAFLTGSKDEIFQSHILLPIYPFPIGLETSGGVMTTLIERNTTYPTRKSDSYALSQIPSIPGSPLILKIYEGRSTQVKDNILVGKLDLSRLQPPPAQIQISIEIDQSGVIEVYAFDLAGDPRRRRELAAVCDFGRLSTQDLQRMLKQAEKLKAHDKITAARIVAKTDLETFVYNLRDTISEKLSPRLSLIDRMDLQKAIENVESWLDVSQEASIEEYEAQREDLDFVCEAIAQRLSDASAALRRIRDL